MFVSGAIKILAVEKTKLDVNIVLKYVQRIENRKVRNKKDAERSLRLVFVMERETRFELATRGLGSRCSTTELHPHDY